MSKWQPIATAPKNGRPVLVSHPAGICVAAYLAGTYAGPPAWYVWQGDTYACDGSENAWDIKPTHWMPLPAAPERKA